MAIVVFPRVKTTLFSNTYDHTGRWVGTYNFTVRVDTTFAVKGEFDVSGEYLRIKGSQIMLACVDKGQALWFDKNKTYCVRVNKTLIIRNASGYEETAKTKQVMPYNGEFERDITVHTLTDRSAFEPKKGNKVRACVSEDGSYALVYGAWLNAVNDNPIKVCWFEEDEVYVLFRNDQHKEFTVIK